METIEIRVERTIQDYHYEPFRIDIKRQLQLDGDEASKMTEIQRVSNNLEKMVDLFMERRMERREQFDVPKVNNPEPISE